MNKSVSEAKVKSTAEIKPHSNGTRCLYLRLYIMHVFIVVCMLFSVSSARARTFCVYQGNYTHIMTVSGTTDNVTLSTSGPRDGSNTDATGYIWYYPEMLKTYTVSNGTVTMRVRDGVSLIFTPVIGVYENKSMDDWNRYQAGRVWNCKNTTWGPNDWKNIIGTPKLSIATDSFIGGSIIFINEPIAKLYSTTERDDSPPVNKPALPSSTLYLNGQITVTSSCSVSPSSLDIDLGEIPSSMREKKERRTINVNCKGSVSGDVYIDGAKVEVGNNINIETKDKNVNFFIRVNKNDFEIDSTSGQIEIDAGIKITPPVTSDIYKGVTYLDLRYH
ncbi:hypothetical protein AA439_18840 [Salmonella enterica subsp. enterica serovar Newport]|nr:hypothetical protein [Salmonella enterica subsp. enterica serovar Sandiego]ECO1039831.1 hypothetical protein [Salmonella enterica subsp. enterica serovar Newport]EDT1688756.1 hypothetical protein [Salmonella enterica subsp. enterica serovar Oslo]ELP3484169.1 hypothetical protein [Salmonella enterica]